jgi:hypothetical protein
MSSVANAISMTQTQVAVAKMQLDSIEQQGRDTLSLIHSAAPAAAAAAPATPANAGPGVGTQVNYSA